MEAAHLKSLSIEELQRLAAAEAASFVLPEGWDEDRNLRYADAIDEPRTRVRDDALSLSTNDEGSILHVSIADTGSFIPRALPATTELARTRSESRHLRMLPFRLSMGIFSLSPPALRPAITLHIPIDKDFSIVREPTITQDKVHINALSYDEVDEKVETDTPDGQKFRDLLQLARGLKTRRTGYDVDPRVIRSLSVGKFIVNECLRTANTSLAQYMANYDIPAIYLSNLSTTNSRQPRYTQSPQPYSGVGTIYMHATSPLRRYAAFVNQANLVAHLESHPYPYPEYVLSELMPQLNESLHENRTADFDPSSLEIFDRPRERKLGANALKLFDKLNQDTLESDDLTTIFFGPMNASQGDKSHLRERALEYIKSRPDLAGNVLHAAIGKKWVRKEVTMGANGRPVTQHFTLTDLEGNQYDYSTRLKGATPAALTIAMLGRVAGIELDPFELTEELHAEARMQKALQDPGKFMRSLDKKTGIDYVSYAEEDAEDQQFRARAMITLNGTQYHSMGYGNNGKSAVQEATAHLIRDLDLVENPPAPKTRPKKR